MINSTVKKTEMVLWSILIGVTLGAILIVGKLVSVSGWVPIIAAFALGVIWMMLSIATVFLIIIARAEQGKVLFENRKASFAKAV